MMLQDQDIPSSCQVRVYLFGPLEVLKREAGGIWKPIEKKQWRDSKPARRVFKRLLAQPGRRLSRSRLQDEIWPNLDFELADKYLYNAMSIIHGIIGKDLVTTWEASYELAGQAVIWTDIDACEYLLKAAENQGYTAIQTLPHLEQALTYLERGEYLEREEGAWCYSFRARAEDMLKQCRFWLAEAYEVQGKYWQAGEQYRNLCQSIPPDEHALCAWIAMLTRQGKIAEALKRYQDIKRFVEGQGFVLPPAIEQVVSSRESQEDVNRRTATKRMSTLVSGLLFAARQPFPLIHTSGLLHSEEAFLNCTTSIPLLWQLYFDGHLAEVSSPLFSEYLPQILFLVQNPNYRERAASLASKAFQLAALIAKHHQNWGDALLYAQRGEQYGQLAEDPNLQIASLIQQANIYFDLRQIWRELQAYQKAYSFSQEEAKQNREVSPLLLGRVYIGLAKSYGKFSDRKQQALGFLGMAHEVYPEHAETDPAFHYSCHTQFTLLNHTGLTYLNIGQPKQALRTFECISVPSTLVPRRLEWLIRMATTAFAMGDLGQTYEHVQLAATSAKTLGSGLRYNEAYNIYEQMRDRWPQEVRVKTLTEYFR